jgi:hypothetical protein
VLISRANRPQASDWRSSEGSAAVAAVTRALAWLLPDHPGKPTVNFRGEKRSNATHQSTTDPEARLAKKDRGSKSKLAHVGHALMENRHGLLVDFHLTHATGTAERDVVPQLLYNARLRDFHPRTLGADKKRSPDTLTKRTAHSRSDQARELGRNRICACATHSTEMLVQV